MATGKRLVTHHLEDISGKVLDEYPDVVRELIKGQAGVYALYKRGKLYYVGLATNLMVRLRQHQRDRHKGVWDRFSVYLTLRDDHIKELESLLLRIVKPEGNKQGGRFVKSLNLRRTVNAKIRESDDDRRAEFVGGWVAKQRLRKKGRSAKGKGALKGLVTKRMTLKAWHGEYEYTASARRDGTIRYGEEVFDSPNAAARAALGRPTGGWRFWKYKNKAGVWVNLVKLKHG